MLKVDLLRAPAVGQPVQDNLDHLDVGFVDPDRALIIAPDVRRSRRTHDRSRLWVARLHCASSRTLWATTAQPQAPSTAASLSRPTASPGPEGDEDRILNQLPDTPRARCRGRRARGTPATRAPARNLVDTRTEGHCPRRPSRLEAHHRPVRSLEIGRAH